MWHIWQTTFAPLILDAFTLHLWATPFTSLLREYASTVPELVATVVLIAALTFTVNLATIKHAELLHETTRVSESPLFRTVFLFAASSTIKRCVGGAGVLNLTVVAFVPLVYVRVPSSIPVLSAVYATVYFVCVVMGTISNNAQPSGEEPSNSYSYFTNALVWVCFVLSNIHHAAWQASHSHYSPSRGRFVGDRDPDSVASCSLWLYEHLIQESTRLAAYRTMVAIGCMLLRRTEPATVGPVAFIERLSLLVTVSTFTCYVHCQHSTVHNSLSSVLRSTVVVVACGMLVDNVEQVACILVAVPAAISFELVSIRRLSRLRLAALGSVKQL